MKIQSHRYTMLIYVSMHPIGGGRRGRLASIIIIIVTGIRKEIRDKSTLV